MERRCFRDNILHWAFRFAILLKGIDGLLELTSGILFLCFKPQSLTHFIYRITESEIIEDPSDAVAHSLRHAFDHLSATSKVFVTFYLLGHGLVKVLLVAGLWRDKHWVFPVAMLAVLGFVIYQLVRLSHHFSPLLLTLAMVDVAVLGLIYREYRSRSA